MLDILAASSVKNASRSVVCVTIRFAGLGIVIGVECIGWVVVLCGVLQWAAVCAAVWLPDAVEGGGLLPPGIEDDGTPGGCTGLYCMGLKSWLEPGIVGLVEVEATEPAPEESMGAAACWGYGARFDVAGAVFHDIPDVSPTPFTAPKI
jgi:hypothetical protein